ncbi:peptidase M4 family protein [Macrococcus hajekii]|uniref:Neutral metalloproteinase n=1 Tax=Macrococcus hajekii TaxID=198482 RepID=A0A4R6BIE6_9STAP|nr:M4 family metallopeptidase [Macrococcus hajekii]TDM01347.1 peptidase M4 family protein [Macrococcus hajekii]GGB10871.1 extracellular elastase [Macrococcus hajekii]
MKKTLTSALLSMGLLATLIPSGNISAQTIVKTPEQAQLALKNLPGYKAVKKNYKQYSVVSAETDTLGFTHYTLKPKAKGKYALNTEIKVHVDAQGNLVMVNGDLNQKTLAPVNNQVLTQAQAITKAYQAAGVSPQAVSNMGRNIVKQAEVVINPELNKLVYNVQLIYLTPEAANWHIQIDAETGAVIKKQNILKETATTGSGTAVNGSTRPLNLDFSKGKYSLIDLTHSGRIETYDAKNTTTTYSLMTNKTKYFTSQTQRAGVDAHYNADLVYDYYKNKFNRNSYDNLGAPIYSIVHYGVNYNNAFWSGEVMVYGDGDGSTFTTLSGANDVVAHELTHAVTDYTAGLIYENQSGALSESFSDVFGYFVDPGDFLIGEDIYTPGITGDGLRSLSNPEQYNQPAHMNQYRYLSNTEAGDYGGVHSNSGIPNKAFYNTVTQLGNSKSEQIYYRALTLYLTPQATFTDARAALVQSATDLYGAADAQIVASAWDQVGVY